jgi:hypothetical protein
MLTKEQIYDMMVKCSGPHTNLVSNTNRVRDGRDLYSTFHFEKFSFDNALRRTDIRFKEFGIDTLEGKTLIDVGSNIGGTSFEALRLGAKHVTGFEYVQDRVNVCKELAGYLGLENRCAFHQKDLNAVLENEVQYSNFVKMHHADVVFCLALDAYIGNKYKLYQLVYDLADKVCFFETNSGIPCDFFITLLKLIGFAKITCLGTSKSDMGYGRVSYKLEKHEDIVDRKWRPLDRQEGMLQFNHTTFKVDNTYVTEYTNSNLYFKIKNLYQILKANPFVIDMDFSRNMSIITPEHGKSLDKIENLSIRDKNIIKKQIVEAVRLLQKANICHMDLHFKNVCYDGKQIKIIDWEFAELNITDIQNHYDISGRGIGGYASELKTFLFSEDSFSIKKTLAPVDFSIYDFFNDYNKEIKLSYVIPHRSSQPDRVKNLQATVKYLINNVPKIEIIVVEQDAKPSELNLPSSVKHIFTYNAGLFNKSWGHNLGFKNATHDIIAFGDNDIIIPQHAIIEGYNKCFECCTISPYAGEIVIDTNQETTEQFISSGVIPENLTGKKRRGPYAGGLIFMSRNAVEIVGGWEEEMRGWGCEDDHMEMKIRKLIGHTHELVDYVGIHLYHLVNNNRSHYSKNVEILMEDYNLSKDELIKKCEKQFLSIGNPNKYLGESEQP